MSFNPQRTFVIRNDILFRQGSSRGIIKAGEATEQKYIADLFEPFTVGFEIDKLFQFGLREVAAVFLYLLSLCSQNGSLGICPFLKHMVVMRLNIRINFSEEFVSSLYSIFSHASKSITKFRST